MSYVRHAARGMAALSAMRVWGVLVGLALLAALARLLPAAEFGLAAIAMTVVAFITLFRDFGLALVVMQRATLDLEDQSTLFWLNLSLTLILTALVLASALPLAELYAEPRVAPLVCGAALSLFISGLTGQHDAQLRRDMAFASIARSDALGLTANLVVSVGAAMIRHDAWAIIFGSIAQSVAHSTTIFLANPWAPRHGLRRDRVRQFLRPGRDVTIYTALNYLSSNVAQILIGYWRGPAALALFFRAQQIVMLPNQLILSSLTQIVLVLLSKCGNDAAQYRRHYLEVLRRTSLVFFVLAAALPFVAHDLVLFVLGSPWSESGRILAWLAPALAAQGIVGIVPPALIAVERSASLRNWALLDVIARGGGVMLGLRYGLSGAAAGFSIASFLISMPLGVVMFARAAPVPAARQLQTCLPAALVGAAVAAGAAIARLLVGDQLPAGLATLLAISLGAGAAGAALLAAIPSTRALARRDLGEMLRMIGLSRKAPPAAGVAPIDPGLDMP